MEQKRIRRWHLYGFLFTALLGPLLHFIYAWSGGNAIAALLGPVNESVWEHLKLLFWPVLFFSTAECFVYGKTLPGFLPAKALSLILGMLTIPTVFYLYSGILGRSITAVDIFLYYLAAAAVWLFSYRLLISQQFERNAGPARLVSLGFLTLLMFCFALFTLRPPEIGLFQDPVNGGYGIAQSRIS